MWEGSCTAFQFDAIAKILVVDRVAGTNGPVRAVPQRRSEAVRLSRDTRSLGVQRVGALEKAQHIAAHESPQTTKLYDRTSDEIGLGEIEKIVI